MSEAGQTESSGNRIYSRFSFAPDTGRAVGSRSLDELFTNGMLRVAPLALCGCAGVAFLQLNALFDCGTLV